MDSARHHHSCTKTEVTAGSGTVLFWGAGATASLGLRTTVQQARFLRALAPDPEKLEMPCLDTRVRSALGDGVPDGWVQAFCDLLEILGDHRANNGHKLSAADIDVDQLAAMARNWGCNEEDHLRKRIVELRNLYDWPALVAAINVCPSRAPQRRSKSTAASGGPGFELIDLFNLLDMHHQSGHGFPGKDGTFLPPQRVLGARGALGLLIQSLSYVDWHMRARTCTDLDHHHTFAVEMGRRMQSRGLQFAKGAGPDDFEELGFILSDVSVVCMNWDPVGLWAQFVANRSLNQAPNAPHVGSPARRMQLYHDLGYFVAGPRVQKDHPGSKVWQPMNISSARQLNDRNHGANIRIRVSKHLFPHGCLWWRECPNCGKLSSYIGDAWEIATKSLLPPPPLKAFADKLQFDSWRQDNRERCEWDLGKVDARACVHCETMTYAHHTPVVMQTSFKTPPPPFLEEIQREMRVVVQKAEHIVLMGYSLPPDDITYRAFLAARIRRKNEESPVRCSVVDKQDGYESRWLYPGDLETKSDLPEVLMTARALFRPENVRYFGAGIPEVFLDGGGTVTAGSVDRFLTWDPR